MARFLLKNVENNGHYLKTDPPTEWEQVEVDQKTGKQVRHRYVVPMFLDPRDPGTHNYQELGQIILSTKHDPLYPRDIVFLGPPTEGMEPLDAEAEALLRKLPRGIGPMSEAAFPSSGPALALAPPQSEIAQFMAQMQGQMALLVGQNEKLAMELAELKAEREEPQFVDAPAPAQSELVL